MNEPSTRAPEIMRPPPGHIDILLPVWGARNRNSFLDFGLPSLLALENLPPLTQLASVSFVLLSTEHDRKKIEQSPLWHRLEVICKTAFLPIDDLVSESSSTVLTLAYALAIRSVEQRMLDTCFVPLVADYVLADGSLANVVGRIFAGASGVLAGNFQVSSETIMPQLAQLKDQSGVLAVAPGELVALSLNAMHPGTLANVVGPTGNHDSRVNRLFWQVDGDCMIGRFYLMHMIAIRPETSEFVVAAPSDYGLIAELCPSGAVVRMGDSAEYFAVECQPCRSGSPLLAAGSLDPRTVARGVAGWATAQHRDNARHLVAFHAGKPSPNLARFVAASDAFVTEVERLLQRKPPLPSRHHPLWPRMLDHHRATALAEQGATRLAAITGDTSLALESGRRTGASARAHLLGRAPDVRPWHPQWPDIRRLREHLTAMAGGRSILVVADVPASVRGWLQRVAALAGATSVTFLRTDYFDTDEADIVRSRAFDSCLVLTPDLAADSSVLAAINTAGLVKAGGTLLVAAGHIFSDDPSALEGTDEGQTTVHTGEGFALVGEQQIARGAVRARVQDRMMRLARKSVGQSFFSASLSLGAAACLAAASVACNFLVDRGRRNSANEAASSAFRVYRRAADGLIDASSAQTSFDEAGSTPPGHSVRGFRGAATLPLREGWRVPHARPPDARAMHASRSGTP